MTRCARLIDSAAVASPNANVPHGEPVLARATHGAGGMLSADSTDAAPAAMLRMPYR